MITKPVKETGRCYTGRNISVRPLTVGNTKKCFSEEGTESNGANRGGGGGWERTWEEIVPEL